MQRKNIILTSMFAIIIATPSMGAVGDLVTTGASCTVGDLGVDRGTANATAQFSVNSYECAAGTYLPADSTSCTTCPANSYCEGDTYEYDASSDQGATSCEDDWGDSYPYSAAGSDNADACYFVAPCPTVSAATACDPHAATCAYTNDAITSNGRIYADGESGPNMPKCSLDFTCATGYSKLTPGSRITAPNTNANSYEYKSHIYPSGSNSQNNSSLDTGEWSATWTGTGTMKGIASCNSVPGNTDGWTWSNDSSNWTLPANTNLASNSADSTDSTRRYCWCKPTEWTPSGGTATSLSAAWVFIRDDEGADDCASICAFRCANYVSISAGFRAAVFGVVGASSQCVANTITLSWNNEDGSQFTSGQCTYDDTLATPSTHPDKRGHTFTGWVFGNANP